MKKKFDAIILARGESKGVLKKNIYPVFDKPLIYWSISAAKMSKLINQVYVSTDDKEISIIAKSYGAKVIERPKSISKDDSTSEEAWIHSLEFLKTKSSFPDIVVGMQPTSPIRERFELDDAISFYEKQMYDSMLSVIEIEDRFIWEKNELNQSISINYDYKNRKRRQQIKKKYLETGSFYIFNSNKFLNEKNRLFGKIGLYECEKRTAFQFDNLKDLTIITPILKSMADNEL